ncbi:hypothetical protein ACP4J4_11920 [Aureimonas ureilytica]|uniref:hypothetical protein n=1 Tax=Aureimonas ureilytica TaxID=401562 RepID=UPI003CED235D
MRAVLLLAVAVLATAPAAHADGYVFRGKLAPIEVRVPAQPLPDGAFRSGPDVLRTMQQAGDFRRSPPGTYRSLRPLADVWAELASVRSPGTLDFGRSAEPFSFCYLPARSIPKCLQEALRAGADSKAIAYERDGFLYYESGELFAFRTLTAPMRQTLDVLGFHHVVRGAE